jgi:SNF2 family DNA or RNA helicase
MIRVVKEGDRYIAKFDWSVEAKDLVKAAGFRFDGESIPKVWYTTDPAIAARLSGDTDAITERLNRERETAQRRKERAIEGSRAASSDFFVPLSERARLLGFDYYGYQRAGIEYAFSHLNCLIGDEMGLGKTQQLIGLVNLPDANISNALVIAKASLKFNWAKEAWVWLAKEMPILIVNGGVHQVVGVSRGVVMLKPWRFKLGGFVIINFEQVKKNRPLIDETEWDLLGVDETHYLKNPKAQRTTAIVGKYDRMFEKRIEPIAARRKVFLSGTPIVNRPAELWTTVRVLDPYGLGRNWQAFMIRYCRAVKNPRGYWDVTGASNLEELSNRLRSSIMIRRLKVDVLPDLPALRRQIITMEPESEEAIAAIRAEGEEVGAIEESLEELRKQVEELSVDEASEAYKEAAAELTRARKVAFERTSLVRKRVAMAKVPQVIEYVRDALEESDQKFILFCHHHDVVDAMVEGLSEFGVVKLDGRDTLRQQDAAKERFQTDNNIRVFVGSIGAAKEGLTLTAASTVIFAELDWVPGNLAQAEARAHRISQNNPVLAQHLVLDGSMDARMTELIVSKMGVIQKVLDDHVEPEKPIEKLVAPKSEEKKKLDEEFTTAQVEAIHECLKYLDSVCDGAQELDNHGFNKLDTTFGKSLAASEYLSQRQAYYGRRLCIKYQRQLRPELLKIIKGE